MALSRHCVDRDDSFDASAEIQIPLLDSIRVHLRCQRAHPGVSMGADVIRALRGLIPYGGQGVFITTADYLPEAEEAAREAGFPLIHLVDGQRLAELLSRHHRRYAAELAVVWADPTPNPRCPPACTERSTISSFRPNSWSRLLSQRFKVCRTNWRRSAGRALFWNNVWWVSVSR